MLAGHWMKRIAKAYPDIAFILWIHSFHGLPSNKNQSPYLQLNLNIMPWHMPWKKHSGYDFSSLFINFLFLNLFPYSVITKAPSPLFNLKLSHHIQSILMFFITFKAYWCSLSFSLWPCFQWIVFCYLDPNHWNDCQYPHQTSTFLTFYTTLPFPQSCPLLDYLPCHTFPPVLMGGC